MDDDRLAYYRAVEDHFAVLRGTPFLFSPKDFAWLERWWRDGVPLGAVLAGVSEVAERRRQTDGEPVSSLAYCRHAVIRHAKRLAAGRSAGGATLPEVDVGAALTRLGAALEAAANGSEGRRLQVVLADLAAAVGALPRDGDPAAVDEALGRLEAASSGALYDALPAAARSGIEARVAAEMAGVRFRSDEVRARSERAHRLKHLREVLHLPRMELTGDEG